MTRRASPSSNVVPLRPGERRRFKAVPLKTGRAAKRGGRADRWFVPTLIALPLAAFAAVFFWDGAPRVAAQPLFALSASDVESARFSECDGPIRYNCVVDGDTFWYQGRKIRIADINAPELSEPGCPAEAALARRATRRLTALLNAGPFTLEDIDRSEDQYGRALKVVRRGGQSLGGKLVGEGLAERWKGYRGEWC